MLGGVVRNVPRPIKKNQCGPLTTLLSILMMRKDCTEVFVGL